LSSGKVVVDDAGEMFPPPHPKNDPSFDALGDLCIGFSVCSDSDELVREIGFSDKLAFGFAIFPPVEENIDIVAD
jgi:hypothetical protein